ncbi:MAG: hypothetical protein JSW23_00525, partial [Planctomycetota bacterium]
LGFAGGVAGGACGFFVTGGNPIVGLAAAALGAIVAVVFEKIFIVLLAGVVAVAFGFAVLAGPYMGEADSFKQYSGGETQVATEALSLRESAEAARTYTADFSTAIKQAGSELPAARWAMIGGVVVILVVIGIFILHLASALCCSALGTVLIFAGMILLLLYKGAEPISAICERGHFYLCVFAGMIVFGTVEQMLVCQPRKGKKAAKKQTAQAGQQPRRAVQSWRTS